MDHASSVDVSVVVASVESARSLDRCIDSIQAALQGVRSELFVVDASRDPSAEIAERKLGSGRVTRCVPGTLTPELWAAGIARSSGRMVALTTGHFVVEPEWAKSLASGLGEGHAGVAGRMDLSDDTSATDWAVFYLRYSEFLSEPERSQRGVPGIPADNAAYEGEAIRRFVAAHNEGFWEVEFHQQLLAAGASLALVGGALARYGRSFPLPTIGAHRFRHGRHAGAWRLATGQRAALAIVAAAPLVPLALAIRAWRRVRAHSRHRGRFVRALPLFLALASAWALGEAVGALAGAPRPRHPVPVPA